MISHTSNYYNNKSRHTQIDDQGKDHPSPERSRERN